MPRTKRLRSRDLIPDRHTVAAALEATEREADLLRDLLKLAHRRETTPEQLARLREALAGDNRDGR